MKKFVKYSLVIVTVLILIGIATFSCYAYNVTADCEFERDYLPTENEGDYVFTAEGAPLKAEITDAEYVRLENVSDKLQKAFLAVEDKRFYKHEGIDYIRILGAIRTNIRTKSFKEGGSTISQQVIKNTHLTQEKTIVRKLREMKLAKQMEKELSKEEILEAYMNIAYFGGSYYGVQNASLGYFGVPCSDLTWKQSAVIAGIVKSPAYYSPTENISAATERANMILGLMLEQEMISDNDYREAVIEPVKLLAKTATHNLNRAYVKSAIAEASAILNISETEFISRNYKLITYLNEAKQQTLSELVYAEALCPVNEYGNTPSKAVVSLNNTTQGIDAYVSTDGFACEEIRRQCGSLMKPLAVYAPAMKYDLIGTSTEILDEYTDFEGYSPRNYNDKYYGWVTAKFALAQSLNVPAVKIMEVLGTTRSIDFLCSVGIENVQTDGLTLALGGTTVGLSPDKIIGGYAVFANGGCYSSPTFVAEIKNASGQTIYRHTQASERVLPEGVSIDMCEMLSECATTGTGKKLKDVVGAHCKTGTVSADNATANTDAWCVYFDSSKTVCCWYGNADMSAENCMTAAVTGGNYPTMLVRDYVLSA